MGLSLLEQAYGGKIEICWSTGKECKDRKRGNWKMEDYHCTEWRFSPFATRFELCQKQPICEVSQIKYSAEENETHTFQSPHATLYYRVCKAEVFFINTFVKFYKAKLNNCKTIIIQRNLLLHWIFCYYTKEFI